MKSLEQREVENANFYSRQAQNAQQESYHLRSENEGLRVLIGELKSQLNEYRSVEGSLSGNRRGSRMAVEELENLPNPKRMRRISPTPSHDHSLILEQDAPSPVSSLGAAFEPLSPGGNNLSKSAPCGNCSDSSCFCSDVGYQIDHSAHSLPLLPQKISSSVALPLRSRTTSGKPSIWHLDAPIPPPTTAKASCSGNPSNCGACKDDP